MKKKQTKTPDTKPGRRIVVLRELAEDELGLVDGASIVIPKDPPMRPWGWW